eukprot:COSAG05_NODE_16069_length_354_cov_0.803922_1_plen_58_part_10
MAKKNAIQQKTLNFAVACAPSRVATPVLCTNVIATIKQLTKMSVRMQSYPNHSAPVVA